MAAAQSLKKAQDLEAKGNKALTKFSFFGSGNSKYEDAAECFDSAGKMYMMAKEYTYAGEVYVSAAELHVKVSSEFDAATSFSKAAESFQKAGDLPRCFDCYERSVATYAGLGKCSMAANMAKKLGELSEAQGQLPKALDAYRQAIDLYDTEGRPQAASSCREKVAFLLAEKSEYGQAQTLFEELGKAALETNLGKFNAKKWFTNAILCALARSDFVAANNKFAEFRAIDYSFEGTREATLCDSLIQACENTDHEAVANAAAEYDKIKRLDPWTTKVLLAIKNSLGGPPLDNDDDGLPDVSGATIHDDALPDEEDAEDLPDLT